MGGRNEEAIAESTLKIKHHAIEALRHATWSKKWAEEKGKIYDLMAEMEENGCTEEEYKVATYYYDQTKENIAESPAEAERLAENALRILDRTEVAEGYDEEKEELIDNLRAIWLIARGERKRLEM